jgi:long-chain acyl-CoA synthetase
MSTDSLTIADLLPRAAALFGERPVIRHQVGEEWRDLSFAELNAAAGEVARGLIARGVEPGDRVCLLGRTRPEWTVADFGICMTGAVVVPIYPTNSPEECEWVIANSGARTVICEDAAQLAKIAAVRERLPRLSEVLTIDPIPHCESLADLSERGRTVAAAVLEERIAGVAGGDLYTIIYTSGSTGQPKGCVHTHAGYRAAVTSVTVREVLRGGEDLVYLFLPLAHSFALIVQLAAIDSGTTVAHAGGDPSRIVAELGECRPTFLPSVPRIFEKIYRSVAAASGPDGPGEALAAKVRSILGGRVREASSGGAPIAPEVLEFFWRCGIPVMEGYGLTETGTAVTVSRPDAHRFGTVGRAVPGIELEIALDGEILISGPSVFSGYYRDPEASAQVLDESGRLWTGDLGRLDEDGYLTISGRKKDIIITAGGKNLTPANLENDMRQSRWVSHAVMHGDRRPYPVMLIALDRDEVLVWGREEGLSEEELAPEALAADRRVHSLIQADLDRANARYARSEQVKRFFVIDRELSAELGELTASMKVRRAAVERLHADRFEELYRER